MKGYKLKIGIFFGTALFFFSPFFSLAQGVPSSVGISLDQSIVAFDGNPGETHTFSLTVSNTIDKKETINLEAQDLEISDNNQILPKATGDEAHSLKEWIKADQVAIQLDPGASRQIFLTVIIPQDAVVGSHAGAILVKAMPEITGENFQDVQVSGQIGVYLLVNVKGEISGKGEIGFFKAPVFTGKKAVFEINYRNQGNIHYVPHGEISIKNVFNKESGKVEVSKHFVFPGQQYAFVEEWDTPSVLGFYKAQASFVDGDGVNHIVERYLFGYFFFPLILIIIVVVVAFLFIWRKNKKTGKKPLQ